MSQLYYIKYTYLHVDFTYKTYDQFIKYDAYFIEHTTQRYTK